MLKVIGSAITLLVPLLSLLLLIIITESAAQFLDKHFNKACCKNKKAPRTLERSKAQMQGIKYNNKSVA